MMYLIEEERSPNFTTNSLHIKDKQGTPVVTVWEIQGKGQDELWDRGKIILDFLNKVEKLLAKQKK